jgi:hypothetical protein
MIGQQQSGSPVPTPFLLHKGWINVKRGLIPFASKYYAALCLPNNVADIQALYEFLFVSVADGSAKMDEKAIPFLGNISFAAVKGIPFLVLLESEFKTDKPQFVHLDGLSGISDEVNLKTACSFCLHFDKSDIQVTCTTSTDYQDWMTALEMAYGMIEKSRNVASRHIPSPIGLENAVPITHSLPRARTSYISNRSSRVLSRAYTESAIQRQSWQGSIPEETHHDNPIASPKLSFDSDNASLHRPTPPEKEE